MVQKIEKKNPTGTPGDYSPVRGPVVRGDTFSPLAPVLGSEFFFWLSPSSTVHGGQYDAKYLVGDIRVAIACGIHPKAPTVVESPTVPREW